jgi:hypothetical protein
MVFIAPPLSTIGSGAALVRGQNLGELEPLTECEPFQQPDDSLMPSSKSSIWRALVDSRLWGRKLAQICDVD